MDRSPGNAADTPEQYRELLQVLVRAQADPRLNAKVDLSGVVQQTLFEAAAITEQWQAWPTMQRVAWLRRVLANNLTDEVRRARAQSRDIDRELSIEQVLAESGACREEWLAADQSSPSSRAARDEDLLRLINALDQLPVDQRRAVELHHLVGLSITNTATAMGKTAQAVVGLLFRGLRQLRERMA